MPQLAFRLCWSPEEAGPNARKEQLGSRTDELAIREEGKQAKKKKKKARFLLVLLFMYSDTGRCGPDLGWLFRSLKINPD